MMEMIQLSYFSGSNLAIHSYPTPRKVFQSWLLALIAASGDCSDVTTTVF